MPEAASPAFFWYSLRTSSTRRPWFFSRAGLGSKVSTWEGPPSQKMWMTRFALGSKCGCFGVRGEFSAGVCAVVLANPF